MIGRKRVVAVPVAKFDPQCPIPYDEKALGDQTGAVYMTKTLEDGTGRVQCFNRHYTLLGTMDLGSGALLKLEACGKITDRWEHYTGGSSEPGLARWWQRKGTKV